jgi:multidrug transporter EmrE-like cation transporter
MAPRSAWLVLLVAGLFETAWAVGLEYSEIENDSTTRNRHVSGGLSRRVAE